MYPNRLAELVDRERPKLGRLAGHCNVDQSTLWRWRKGQSEIPYAQTFLLAEFFGVDRDWLVSDEDQSEQAA